MDELAQLIVLCEKMGAPRQQAETMAKQLAKLADQLGLERKITRVEAMAGLLQVLIKGRNGEGPDAKS